MTALTRRRDPEAPDETWRIYFGTVIGPLVPRARLGPPMRHTVSPPPDTAGTASVIDPLALRLQQDVQAEIAEAAALTDDRPHALPHPGIIQRSDAEEH